MTEKSCRLMVSDYYERAGPLKGFTPTPSTRAHDKCQNRFYVILIDQFFTASRQHVHGRPLEQVEKNTLKLNWVHEIVFGTPVHRQMPSWMKMRCFLGCDSNFTHSGKRFLHRDLKISTNVRKRLVLPELSAALSQAKFRGNRSLLSVGVALKR